MGGHCRDKVDGGKEAADSGLMQWEILAVLINASCGL